MSVKKVDVFQFTTTPNKLRSCADQLDRMWGQAGLGEDVPKMIYCGVGCELHIVIDQEEKYREEHAVRKGLLL